MTSPLELLAAIRAEAEANRPPSMFDGRVYIELPPAAVREAVRQQLSRELGREVEAECTNLEKDTVWHVGTKKPTPPNPTTPNPISQETAELIS